MLGCTAVNQASAMRAVAQLGRDLRDTIAMVRMLRIALRRGDGPDGAKEPEDSLSDDIAFLSIRTCLHPNDRIWKRRKSYSSRQ